MLLAGLRRWWWRRSHVRFYADREGRPYQLNAGTERGFELLVEELQAILKPQPDDVVLDVGGGNGELSQKVFTCCRRVIVADLCRPVDRMAREFVNADGMHLPFVKESFSIVFAYSVFPHLGSERDAAFALREWTSLLGKNGTLFIGDIPERTRLAATVRRGFQKPNLTLAGKYWFAISMLTYFSRERLQRILESLGLEARALDQQALRRFSRERFDILATKAVGRREL